MGVGMRIAHKDHTAKQTPKNRGHRNQTQQGHMLYVGICREIVRGMVPLGEGLKVRPAFLLTYLLWNTR